MTHPQSFWSPDMRRTTAESAQQKDSPAGYIRSRGASLSGHCGPGLQGRPLLSTAPPRSSHAGLSQPDVGVSGGRDECREQKLVTTTVTTKYLILILNIAFLWRNNSVFWGFFWHCSVQLHWLPYNAVVIRTLRVPVCDVLKLPALNKTENELVCLSMLQWLAHNKVWFPGKGHFCVEPVCSSLQVLWLPPTVQRLAHLAVSEAVWRQILSL